MCEECKDIFSLHEDDGVTLSYLLWILIQDTICLMCKTLPMLRKVKLFHEVPTLCQILLSLN